VSRHPSPRRSYGNVTGAPIGAREQDQTSTPPSPPSNAYRAGWCANGHDGEVAPTQLEIGGPTYPICRGCNTEAAVYRDDYRGYYADDDDRGSEGDFRAAVSKAFNRVVPAEVRGPKWFYAPRHRGEAGRAR
jgi:hypothetical protein